MIEPVGLAAATKPFFSPRAILGMVILGLVLTANIVIARCPGTCYRTCYSLVF